MRRPLLAALVLLLLPAAPGCGRETAPPAAVLLPPEVEQTVVGGEGWRVETQPTPGRLAAVAALSTPEAGAPLAVSYPRDGSIFPPDLVPPRILWKDSTERVSAWLIEITPAGKVPPLQVLVPGRPPPLGEIDPTCIAPTNELPDRPGPFDRSWEVPPAVWEVVKAKSRETWTTLRITGFDAAAPDAALSRAEVRFKTSKDPVGAPIFYRDVPLAPAETAKGTIKPLAKSAVALITWRLRDVSKPASRVVLAAMPTCANCHSFSRDGSTFGMDIDGPEGDKGTYAFLPVAKDMVIDYDDILTWNDFPGRKKGHNTLGFLSRISPDGRYAVATVNEALYVANYKNYEFLQVFYPTRGILAVYDRETKAIRALPGADDPTYVHTNAVFTPDGRQIVFSRAKAQDPYIPGRPMAAYPGDPNETPVQYDLVRMDFEGGKGGSPEAIEGASANGWSNTFPKISPDGRWIVFVRCKNGQLMRPDGKLFIVPFVGGAAREMRCNTWRMNSWHSFAPNGRWMVFSSKANTPYTQMFLTHLDENGNDSPPILIPNSTAANRAVNIPEFMNGAYDDLQSIEVPGVDHRRKIVEGYGLMGEGQVSQALALFQEATRLNPRDAKSFVNLGWALAAQNRPAEALEAYERAVVLDPEYALALNNLGNALMKRNRDAADRERALALLARSTRLDPTLMRARRNLALLYLRMGRLEEAKTAYEAILGREPRNAPAHGALGTILLRLGRPADAVEHMEAAVRADPDDTAAANTLAWQRATSAHAEIRDGKRAVTLAEAAAARTGRRDANVLDTLAAAYAETGRYADAAATAEEALSRLGDVRRGGQERAIRARLAAYRKGQPYRSP